MGPFRQKLLFWYFDIFSGDGVFEMEVVVTDMHKHVVIFNLINCTFESFVDVVRCHFIGPSVGWFKQRSVSLHEIKHGHVLTVIDLR